LEELADALRVLLGGRGQTIHVAARLDAAELFRLPDRREIALAVVRRRRLVARAMDDQQRPAATTANMIP